LFIGFLLNLYHRSNRKMFENNNRIKVFLRNNIISHYRMYLELIDTLLFFRLSNEKEDDVLICSDAYLSSHYKIHWLRKINKKLKL